MEKAHLEFVCGFDEKKADNFSWLPALSTDFWTAKSSSFSLLSTVCPKYIIYNSQQYPFSRLPASPFSIS